jgi:hypothetical protein
MRRYKKAPHGCSWSLGWRVTISTLEFADYAKQVYAANNVLPYLRSRSSLASWCSLWSASGGCVYKDNSVHALQDVVDLLDEARDIALARTAVYQQAIRNYHSRRVRTRGFSVGDLVLRLKTERSLKLESPWKGPFIVTEVIPGGAYRLKNTASGKDVGNLWNVAHLRRFYA